jgi:hypothetical protein
MCCPGTCWKRILGNESRIKEENTCEICHTHIKDVDGNMQKKKDKLMIQTERQGMKIQMVVRGRIWKYRWNQKTRKPQAAKVVGRN